MLAVCFIILFFTDEMKIFLIIEESLPTHTYIHVLTEIYRNEPFLCRIHEQQKIFLKKRKKDPKNTNERKKGQVVVQHIPIIPSSSFLLHFFAFYFNFVVFSICHAFLSSNNSTNFWSVNTFAINYSSLSTTTSRDGYLMFTS